MTINLDFDLILPVRAINLLCEKLIKNIDDRLYRCFIFFDLSKAFASVNYKSCHGNCITISVAGAQGLNLFKSYLGNRYQYMNILGHYSSDEKTTIVVPQGSCLGLLLFLFIY